MASHSWPLAMHASGARPNGHDFLLHRRHKGTAPRAVQLELSSGSRAAPRLPVLLAVHGFNHTASDYELQATVLARSAASWLLRHSDLLLVVNSLAVTSATLQNALQRYPVGGQRLLVHTGLDVGHLCSEFQLLAATSRIWSPYEWVLYLSGPDEHLVPLAVDRLTSLVQHDSTGAALFADSFPGALAGGKNKGPLVSKADSNRDYVARWALDVLLFRPAPLMLPGGRRSSVWWDATAVCTAQRAYHGLPETVLHWVKIEFNLSFGAIGIGSPARWADSRQRINTWVRTGSVWHTHNASAVHEWLSEAANG